MPKTTIKVYFNNGCTTLIYNEMTSAEDIIGVVIKGRLSLNELRYKHCFQLRATKYSHPIKDFDHLNLNIKLPDKSIEEQTKIDNLMQQPYIEEFIWIKNDITIKEWLESLETRKDSRTNEFDYWKLQLRIRHLSTDLNEIKFKDPVTFSYYYEQTKNDFIFTIAPKIKNADLIPLLLDLGCLEMRRSFQNMSPSILDKKINYEYLEKDVGLKRFFPEIVLSQKSKNVKKMIIKGLKVHESLNEIECMLKYLEKLLSLWKFNEETYNCHLGNTWGVPIIVKVGYEREISCFMNNSKEPFQVTTYEKILQITTELDENESNGLLNLKIADAKELLTFRFESLQEAENMASIIDGYCFLKNKSISIWKRSKKNLDLNIKLTSDINRKSFDHYNATSSVAFSVGSPANRTVNSVHILSESEDSKETTISLDITNNGGSNNDLYLGEANDIKRDSLVFHEKLGSGQFGDVFKGTFKKSANFFIEIAIKQLKIGVNALENIELEDQLIITKKFIKEAKIMEKFDHPHIIKFLGMCYDGPLLILMELAKFGQLKNYLQNNKDHIDTISLILYSYQLSSAMAYLENKKFVHRDIAARNVLVSNHESIKLADFGLSREIDDEIYLASKCKLPIKWMAPESINFRKFTHQSDVWMFGICIWEILSYGCKPFQGIKNPDVIKLIENKKRLQRPSNCPDELYLLMLHCWEYDSSQRPTFTVIKGILNQIYNTHKENKLISNSLSIGSSFMSNTSTSSSESDGIFKRKSNDINNTVTMMMKMPLGKNLLSDISTKFQALDTSSFIPPPPKPSRNNNISNLSLDNFSNKKIDPDLESSSFSKPNYTSYDNELSMSNKKFPSNDKLQYTNYNKINQFSPSVSAKINHTKSPLAKNSSESDFKYSSNNKLLSEEFSSNDAAINNLQNDYIWLNEKFKTWGIDQQFQQTTTSSNLVNSNKDLLLRDQTLQFIQSISVFIRYLSTDNQKLERELNEIMESLNSLIKTIQANEISSHMKLLNKKIEDLEILLGIMIEDVKKNQIENVINTALELARNANELFLEIISFNTSNNTTKAFNKTTNV